MKDYVRPMMESEVFAANEYIAACAENTYYNFECNAGDGRYGGLYDERWRLVSNGYNSYHACGETHVTSRDSEFFKGYFDPDRNHNNGNELEVYIWEEKGWTFPWGWGTVNRHATTNLDINSWKNHS